MLRVLNVARVLSIGLAAFVIGVGFSSAKADGTPVVGRRYMAVDPAVLVYDGNRSVANAKQLESIFQAVAVRGEWLAVHSGGVSGWVRAGDVVALDGAFEFFSRRIAANPQDLAAYTSRGIASKERGDFDRAIADHSHVIEKHPKPAAAYVNRGNVWAQKEAHDAALSDYAAAIRHDPSLLAAYNNLAWALATRPEPELRDGRRAVEAAKKACELTNWKNPECLDTLAAAYAETGDFDRAVQCSNQAMSGSHPQAIAYRRFFERRQMYQNRLPYRQLAKAS